ncbi:MAG: FISUMP domain-containing protein [Ignavibacteriaceae bacterium]|nr:FISUMP domain-containing protein [Ignavibacteriaceae bacterium]
MRIFYLVLFLLLPSLGFPQSACPGLDSINYSGQWYHTVQIGSQCWLKENLNVGVMIPAVRDQINNDTIEKFCYNNDPAMCDIYGGLYQWREAVQYTFKSRPKGICPPGWHIPSDAEFDTLLSSVNKDGNALKEIGQGGGTNTSGFSCLLSGDNELTSFNEISVNANIWCSNSKFDLNMGSLLGSNKIIWNDAGINFINLNSAYGMSIRCIKDDADLILQSPYGGENWQVGSVHNISWGGNDLPNIKIRIEYSTNNGISWIIIVDSAPAQDGNYSWIIPNSPSKSCKVRLTDLNNPNSVILSDTDFIINNDPCLGQFTINYGNKTYSTVVIKGKCWFKDNLNTGTMIPGNQTSIANGTIEKYCYNDDTSNCYIYGGLYSRTEMNEPSICPAFWHVTSSNEFINLLTDDLFDGNSLKTVGQGSGFGLGSNTSGFSLLLAGYRWSDGTFQALGNSAYLPYVQYFIFNNSDNINFSGAVPSSVGGSIRCIMDDLGPLTLKSPVGGESWIIGTTHKITWGLSNVINIKIDYSTNNGTSWINIITSTPNSAGSYNWTIPNTPSTNCKVKITSTNSSDTNSISNLFQIYQVPTNPCPGIPTVNYAGQTYNTVVIGDQCWMRENLNIGTMIDSTQNQTDNGIIEKYCYNNDTANCSIYGGLYQWNEAMQYDTSLGTKGICPMGWHIPTRNEFTALKTFVGGNGNDLKEIGQGTGSGVGTNASGFSALLAGGSSNGAFISLGLVSVYWSSNVYDVTRANNFQLLANNNYIGGGPVAQTGGQSIRCINDSSVSALPVELTSFTASINNRDILLKWNTAIEVNFSSFEVERKKVNINIWQPIDLVPASGNSTSPKQYSYVDKRVNTGEYNYRLKMIDFNGTFKYSNIININISSPDKFELLSAYPNPWNPTTTIRYQVPINIQVKIKVFDALGREVSTLVNEVKQAGIYEVILNGKGLASGIYYYQMKAGNFIGTKKIILIK